MTTLREEISDAAFWHKGWCLGCHTSQDDLEEGECPECGGQLTPARVLEQFVAEVTGEE